MRRKTVLVWALAVVFAAGMFVSGIAADEKSDKAAAPAKEDPDLANLPGVIRDESVNDWVVDRFVGNSTAGNRFYQGPALEVGGLQRAGGVVEAGDGTFYVTSAISGSRAPRLMQITPDGVLRVFMEKRGLIEGPIGECRSGGETGTRAGSRGRRHS